jgi:hypothetical protein
MDDCYRRLNILLRIYLSYIKMKLKVNSKLNKMYTYAILNETNSKKLEDEFIKEGYYISNYRPNIYLIHPILYND